MAITLITGSPGSGKTLLLLWEVENRRKSEKRQVFYSGIKDLLLPWESFGGDSPDPSSPHMTDPATWNTLPVGSIIVIDECQRLFRTRPVGSKVPEYVAQLETHRHKGYDIYLVTQAPALIDSNVRNLVETHKHLMRKFGSKWATIHEWKGVKTNCISSRKDSQESQFRYPKEVFTWYKSAEVHTVKFRMPAKFMILLAMPFVLAAAVWFAASRLAAVSDAPAIAPEREIGLLAGGELRSSSGGPEPVDYFASLTPRLEGFPNTAPRYDAVTTPVVAPYPAACVASKDACNCYTQQGTRLMVPLASCRSIVEVGYFVDWDTRGPEQREAMQQESKPLQLGEVQSRSSAPGDPRDAEMIASVRFR